MEFNAYYARTRTANVRGEEDSYQSQFAYNGDRYGVQLEHLKVGDAFQPGVGFLRRQDFRRSYLYGRFSPRPKSMPAIRKLAWEGNLELYDDGDGRLESRARQGTFRIDLQNGDSGNVSYLDSYEFLERPFLLAPGLAPLVGGYRFRETNGSYRLGPKRRLNGVFTLGQGSFYSGDRTQAGYTGRVEVTPRFSIEPRISFNWISLPDGRFSARLLSTRSTYTLTPRMFVSALLQYNSSTNTFSTNARVRWEYAPGSEFFLVYNEGRNTLDGPAEGLASRALAVKLTRLFRF